MCDHEEILDNEGYGCIKCCLVSGQEYIYEENSFNDQIKINKDIGMYSSICNILEHLQLNSLRSSLREEYWSGESRNERKNGGICDSDLAFMFQ